MTKDKFFDAIIIGGSYAGLSAAMALGRSLRNVLIIDSGLPCNRMTPHSHNFITHDGEKPSVIAQKAREQVLRYSTVTLINEQAERGQKSKEGFAITTGLGATYQGRKLILATGIKDQLPPIEGITECWGISVIHCPYCHGYEVRGKKTGIMANGKKAVHIASLVNNLTDDITILTTGTPELDRDELAKLSKHNIKIIETKIAGIEHESGYVKNVVFADGQRAAFDAVYAAVPFVHNSDIPASLGCEFTEEGHIKVDNFQKTTTEGVYACGDNAVMFRTLANAVYSGNLAGAMVNMELTHESF